MPSQLNWMRRIEARIEELEARGEAVEPEKHTCGECGFFPKHTGCRMLPQDIDDDRFYYVEPGAIACENFVARMEPEDTDATIRKLRGKLAEIRFARLYRKEECEKARVQLADAKAEIERLQKNCDYLYQKRAEAVDARVEVIQKLTKAKAEMAKLQARCDRWLKRCEGTECQLFVERENRDADAEIGRLVRGMGTHTRLTKGDMLYKAETKQVDKWVKTYPDRTMFLWNDLIDALRSIQEVDDG